VILNQRQYAPDLENRARASQPSEQTSPPCGFSAFWPPFTQTQLRGGTRVLPASVDEGRAASAADRPKYIFLIQLPLRCEEKTCFFKPIRRPGEHNFYI